MSMHLQFSIPRRDCLTVPEHWKRNIGLRLTRRHSMLSAYKSQSIPMQYILLLRGSKLVVSANHQHRSQRHSDMNLQLSRLNISWILQAYNTIAWFWSTFHAMAARNDRHDTMRTELENWQEGQKSFWRELAVNGVPSCIPQEYYGGFLH